MPMPGPAGVVRHEQSDQTVTDDYFFAGGNPLIKVSLTNDDLMEVDADVLLLKYAQAFYGADEAISLRLLQDNLCNEQQITPAEGVASLIEARGAVASRKVLFLGTPSLGAFRYREIRQFAQRAIEALAALGERVATLATTIHGAGYGLDIEEVLRSMILGFQQGLTTHPLHSLKNILFVERSPRRYEILDRALGDVELVLPPEAPPAANSPLAHKPVKLVTSSASSLKDLMGNGSRRKKSVFVAMPFSDEFEDVYQFGIYATVRRCGFVCEKVDEALYSGSIIDRITEGIRNADFVIADLTCERPNVYLEVGYAWGLQKPVITLAREGQHLHFDLSHHKCLFYKTITRLSESLEKTIRELFIGEGEHD
jgi:hypothetical protein